MIPGWLRLAVALWALALAGTGCGGSQSSPSPSCQPAPGSSAAALAAESALFARGRADADFTHAFRTDSQALLDAADASRTELLQQLAANHGLTLPPAGAPTSS
jgi:hypothetical protein